MARLIVPIDYSSTAQQALDQAFLLAKNNNDEVELLHIVIVSTAAEPLKVNGKAEEVRRLKALAEARIKALSLPISTRWRAKVLHEEHFLEGLIDRFERAKAKLVVMGTTGVNGLANKIFGSNTANLIGKSALPLLAIPPNWKPDSLKKLVFCTTPEQVLSQKKYIKKWAKWFSAEAQVVHFSSKANIGMGKERMPFPVKFAITLPEGPHYQDLVEYSTGLKNTVLCMFVHERLTVFERIFDKSLTGQVAGHAQVPILALPLKMG